MKSLTLLGLFALALACSSGGANRADSQDAGSTDPETLVESDVLHAEPSGQEVLGEAEETAEVSDSSDPADVSEVEAPLAEKIANGRDYADALLAAEDPDVVEKTVAWLLADPDVSGCAATASGDVIVVAYVDGSHGAIVVRPFFANGGAVFDETSLAAQSPTIPIAQMPLLMGPTTPEYRHAFIYAPFVSLAPELAAKVDRVEAAAATAGFDVSATFRNQQAGVGALTNVALTGFAYIQTHAWPSLDKTKTWLATRELWLPFVYGEYKKQFPEVGFGLVAWSSTALVGDGLYLALSDDFFDRFHYPDALVVVDACHSFSKSLEDAFLLNGAAGFVAWRSTAIPYLIGATATFVEKLLEPRASFKDAWTSTLDFEKPGDDVPYSMSTLYPIHLCVKDGEEASGDPCQDLGVDVACGVDEHAVCWDVQYAFADDVDEATYYLNPLCEDETCNGFDDNCDGRTDEADALGCTPYFVDGDDDGFGAGDARCLCAPEAPYVVETDGDCRDDKAKVHPGADELCDGLDNDCNTQTDEGGVCVEPCVDNDSDGFGVGPGCTGQPDCDDTKAKVYPNAPEKCDGLDNDCDTQTDEDDVCGEPPFENPDDTETEDVQVTVTQVETTPGSKQIKLFAKVETQQGKPLQQLTIGNFVLRETIGGATQTLPLDSLFATKETGEGMSAGLLIDSSGSMGSGEGSPLAQAKVAAKLFVSKLKPQDAAAVVDFGSDVHVNADFTNDKQTLFGAIDACSDGGMTSMYDALSTGIGMIAGRAGQRALVLLSDGGDNDSACSPCAPNDAVGPAVAAGVPIFTIGLGASPGSGLESDLIAISNGTFAGQNGSAYYATVDPLGLQAIYDAIATVLKNMYVIGWYTQGDSGETVDVTITVTYTCASGTFTDTFVTSYVVP